MSGQFSKLELAQYREFRKEKFDTLVRLGVDFLTELPVVFLRITPNGSNWQTIEFTEEEWEVIKAVVDGALSGSGKARSK